MKLNKITRFTLSGVCGSLFFGSSVYAGMEDDPLLGTVRLDQMEIRDADGDNPTVWDIQGWVGKDLQKLWVNAEGEYADSETEEAELQLLYSRAVAPFWDVQIGWRGDFKPEPERNWLAVGIQGVAPYFFETDAAFFVGESGRTALRLEAEYEFLFTQKLILSPEVEVNFYGQNDEETGNGSGLSDVEAGLRLRYELVREFAPYIGVNWEKKFGSSADFARAEGEETSDVEVVIGIRAWF